MLILVSRDFRMNGPNLPVNTNLTSSAAAVYRTITNKDLEQTCQSLGAPYTGELFSGRLHNILGIDFRMGAPQN